ncbi:MAG: hypothetical protein ABIA04_14615 [Pseudomonadota bacterium]
MKDILIRFSLLLTLVMGLYVLTLTMIACDNSVTEVNEEYCEENPDAEECEDFIADAEEDSPTPAPGNFRAYGVGDGNSFVILWETPSPDEGYTNRGYYITIVKDGEDTEHTQTIEPEYEYVYISDLDGEAIVGGDTYVVSAYTIYETTADAPEVNSASTAEIEVVPEQLYIVKSDLDVNLDLAAYKNVYDVDDDDEYLGHSSYYSTTRNIVLADFDDDGVQEAMISVDSNGGKDYFYTVFDYDSDEEEFAIIGSMKNYSSNYYDYTENYYQGTEYTYYIQSDQACSEWLIFNKDHEEKDVDGDGFNDELDIVYYTSLGVVAGDFDGSGSPEFVLSMEYLTGFSETECALYDKSDEDYAETYEMTSFRIGSSYLSGGEIVYSESFGAGYETRVMATGDLDGDGDDELVLTKNDASDGTMEAVLAYDCDLDDCDEIDVDFEEDFTSIVSIILKDIDDDDRAEVIIAGKGPGYLNLPGFKNIDAIRATSGNAYGIVVYDDKESGFDIIARSQINATVTHMDVFNGDADSYLEIAAITNDNKLHIINFDGTSLEEIKEIDLETSAIALTTGDVDGDTLEEVVVALNNTGDDDKIVVYEDIIFSNALLAGYTDESSDKITDIKVGNLLGTSSDVNQIIYTTNAEDDDDKVFIIEFD